MKTHCDGIGHTSCTFTLHAATSSLTKVMAVSVSFLSQCSGFRSRVKGQGSRVRGKGFEGEDLRERVGAGCWVLGATVPRFPASPLPAPKRDLHLRDLPPPASRRHVQYVPTRVRTAQRTADAWYVGTKYQRHIFVRTVWSTIRTFIQLKKLAKKNIKRLFSVRSWIFQHGINDLLAFLPTYYC